tara:strand:+ start:923 stop:1303 length:381 start_codon:yes stop_codon:yes gene_type:complete
MENMRICIDIDGVICHIKNKNQSYVDVEPIEGASEKIKALKDNGHYIILHTARRMKTHKGNVGSVISDIGKITIDWLEKYEIPYDEIYFGKPWANIYIDDNALRFQNWSEIDDLGQNFPTYNGLKS